MHHLAVLSFFVVGSVCLHDVHASRDCAIMMQAGQGGQVELEGVVSSRAAARTTESKPEEEQPKKRTSRRRLQRGSAAFEGDQLAKSVMEQTIKSDEAGNAYINRATFGNGEMQWYGIGGTRRSGSKVVVGKEKKFKEILEQRMEATPLATDDLTGTQLGWLIAECSASTA
eukprot:1140855-Pelagomonas_calceolata.AAC.2